jgi:hypothetical protein
MQLIKVNQLIVPARERLKQAISVSSIRLVRIFVEPVFSDFSKVREIGVVSAIILNTSISLTWNSAEPVKNISPPSPASLV